MATTPKLLRATAAGDVVCKQCHIPFLQNFADAKLSHPIVTDYSAFAADPRFKPFTDLGNGKLSTNVGSGDVRLVSGGISCTTCHATHFADSSANSTDSKEKYLVAPGAPTWGLEAGDGKLLRADGPQRVGADQNATAQLRSNLCQACHTYKMHGKPTSEDAAAIQVGCLDCHGGHSFNGGNPSVYVLRNSVVVPTSPRGILATPGTVIVGSYLKPYAYGGAENYQAWSDRITPGADGYCEKCHGDVEGTTIGPIAPTGHPTSALAGCDSCHFHNASGWSYSFKPDVSGANCGQCHGFPPHLAGAGNRSTGGVDGGYAYSVEDGNWNYSTDSGSYKDETQTGHLTHAGGNETTGPNYYFVGSSGTENCDVCHGAGSGFNTRHRNSPDVGQVNPNKVAGGDATSFRDVPFNSVATTPGKPAPVYKLTGGADPQWSCTNIECHSNGGPADDTGARSYTVTATPAWQTAINAGVHLYLDASDRCSKCHGATVALMTSKGNSSAHGKHIDSTTYNYGCNVCHAGTAISNTALKPLATLGNKSATGGGKHVNKNVEVEYDGTVLGGELSTSTWTLASGTCSTYCHSDGAGLQATPDWQKTGLITCTSCHKGNVASGTAMSTGSHSQHITAVTVGPTGTIGRQMGCVECHSNTVDSDTTVSTPANHVNGDPTWGIQADANKPNCSAIKCHSNGNLDGGTVTYQADNAYTWGGDNGTIGCANCHGNGTVAYPTYANGGIGNNSNSHAAHNTIACGECHATVSTNGTAINGTTPANHVNQSIDVSGPQFAWVGGSETCNTITCHGSGSAQWGATSLACGSCHQHATTDTDDFTYGNATPAVVATNEWAFSGHGKTTGTYTTTGRSAANFPGAAGTGDPCKYCHDNTVTHNDANYFRLRINTVTGVTVGDLNTVCLGCHGTNGTGVDPDGGLTVYASKTSTVKVNKYHQGGKHSGTTDGGRWCWDCHDPHGDASAAGSRIQMIQKRAQVNPNANGVPASLTGSTDIIFTDRTIGIGAGAFARDITGAGAAAGICNACHTTTLQYTNTTGKGTHSTAVCTTCHQHNADNVYDGLAFKGSGCNGCHGNASNGQYWPDGTGGSPVYVDDSAGSATAHNKHITAIGAFLGYGNWATVMYTDTQQKTICAFCHATPGATGHDTDSAPLSTVDVLGAGQITRFKSDALTTELDPTSGAYAAGSCATLSCHNGVTTPVWNSGPASDCTNTCHVPNSGASAREGHLKHVNGKAYACTECHINNGTNYGHINGQVNLKFDNAGSREVISGGSDGSYSQALNSTPRDGSYGNCGNMYCHADKLSPNWDQTIITATGCTACHTAGGSALFNPTSGLHNGVAPSVSGVKHDETLSGGCAACHTVGALGSHINGVFSADGSVAGDRTNMGLFGTYVNGGSNNLGTCITACHLTNSADWAHKWMATASYTSATASCAGCHGDWLNNGTTSWNTGVIHLTTADTQIKHGTGTTYDCKDCHNLEGIGYTFSFGSTDWGGGSTHGDGQIQVNNAANITYNSTSGYCEYCHTSGAYNFSDTGWTIALAAGPAITTTCGECHITGGVTSGSATGAHAIHGATAASVAANPASIALCLSCHGNDGTGASHNNGTVNFANVTYSASRGVLSGTCSTTNCHNRGTPVTQSSAWNVTGLACNACHYYAATTTPTAAGNSTNASLALSADHGVHFSTGGTFACSDCHGTDPVANDTTHINGTTTLTDKAVAVAFEATISAAAKGTGNDQLTAGTATTCNNAACHNPSATTYSANWEVSTSSCTLCHGNAATPPASGSHVAHLQASTPTTFGITLTCTSCHPDNVGNNRHTNGVKLVQVAKNSIVTTVASPLVLNGCGTNDCHNNGVSLTTGTPGAYTWGTAAGNCTVCHGDATSQSSNAHNEHMNGGYSGAACTDCHLAATVASHINKSINLDSTKATYSRTATVAIGGTPNGTCATASCHNRSGAASAAWNIPTGTGTPGTNDLACDACHYYAASPTAAGNTAHFDPLTTSHGDHFTAGKTCTQCHGTLPTTTAHITTKTDLVTGATALQDEAAMDWTNAAAVTDYTLAADNTCGSATNNGLGCHATGTPDWDVAFASTACINCHSNFSNTFVNPTSGLHGVVPSISGTQHDDSFGVGGTCASCHTSVPTAGTHKNGTFTGNGTIAGDRTNMGLFAAYTTSGTNDLGTCATTSCHRTNSDDWAHKWMATASYTSATLSCAGCHGDWSNTWNAGTIHRTTAGTQTKHGTGTTYDCKDCHNLEGTGYTFTFDSTDWGGGSTHGDDQIQVNNAANINYNSTSGYCEYCHTSGAYNFSDTSWAIALTAGSAIVTTCAECHGYPPTPGDAYSYQTTEGKGAHVKHVTHIAARASKTLNASTDTFTGTTSAAVCGVCHDVSTTANHTTGGGGPRNLLIPAATYQFGPSAPTFNGTVGQPSSVDPKSCSNVSCHFKTTPVWE